MASTDNSSRIVTEHSNLTDFFTYISGIFTVIPSFRKHPLSKQPIVDANGNKELVGFVAIELSSEISNLTDDDIDKLRASVKSFKSHWNLFSGDSRMIAFGKFNSMTKDEMLSQAQDL